MRFTRTTPPASADQLQASAASLRAEIAGLEAEERDCNSALADLVGDPGYEDVEARACELRFLIPTKRDTLARIEKAIPAAAERDRRKRIEAEIEDQALKSAKLQRGLEARYTKAAEAFAEVCREVAADADRWRSARLSADTVSPRLPVPYRSAEMALRYEKFSTPNGLESVTEGLTIRAWDGNILFRS